MSYIDQTGKLKAISMLPPDLIEWVSRAGAVAAPIFLFLWWDERADRKAGQIKMETMAERMLTNAVEVKSLLQTVVDIYNGRKQ